MNFGEYSYLVTTLIFGLSACLVEFIFGRRHLIAHWRLLVVMALVGIFGGVVGEGVALKWDAWWYNPHRYLGIDVLGIPLETHVWSVLVVLAISGASILWGRYEERGQKIWRTTWRKLCEKLRD